MWGSWNKRGVKEEVIKGFLVETKYVGEIREEANIKVKASWTERGTVGWKKKNRPTCQKKSSQPEHQASLDTWSFVSSYTPASAHTHTPSKLNVQGRHQTSAVSMTWMMRWRLWLDERTRTKRIWGTRLCLSPHIMWWRVGTYFPSFTSVPHCLSLPPPSLAVCVCSVNIEIRV